MSEGDRILDAETLFRRVPMGGGRYSIQDDGVRISAQAFSDRQMQPSVDRAALNDGDPARTQLHTDDGVLSLVAGDVRGITYLKGEPPTAYRFDVAPAPLEDNPAYAEIRAAPSFRSKSHFRKLQERLALIAMWRIRPRDLRAD